LVKPVNIQQAKTHLSRYPKRVKQGESLVICDRNVPVAELRPLHQSAKPERPLGALRGAVLHMADSFNEPLAAEGLAAFAAGEPGDDNL
jgi:antitoxin (DNA-binding transcriptional repressor) of toxin-antitoxin stability system